MSSTGRRRPYRLATRALPSDYRAAHGDELVTTALELGDGRWKLCESARLVTHGLRTRTLRATRGSARTALARALVTAWQAIAAAYAVMLASFADWLVLSPAGIIATLTSGEARLLFAVLALVLLSRSAAALTVVLPVSIVLPHLLDTVSPVAPTWPVRVGLIVQAAVLVAVGLWAVHGQSHRPSAGRSVLFMAASTAVGLTLGMGAVVGVTAFAMMGAVVAGIAVVAWDPRPLLLGSAGLLLYQSVTLPFMLDSPADIPTAAFLFQISSVVLAIGCGALSMRRVGRLATI